MAYDLEEQESLAEIKAWWEKWGNLILTVVTVACLCAAGFQGWRWYQMKESTDAGVLYAQMIQASNMKDEARVQAIAGRLHEAMLRRRTPEWGLCLLRIMRKPPVSMPKQKKHSSGSLIPTSIPNSSRSLLSVWLVFILMKANMIRA